MIIDLLFLKKLTWLSRQEAQDGSEEDEELAEWERAQMRKGGFTGGNKHDDDDQKNILGPYNPKGKAKIYIPFEYPRN